jgi:hypothetical protein
MTNKEKAQLLLDRHLKLIIEWGGVSDMFTNCSDMTIEGVAELLDILQLNDKEEINSRLSILIEKENERQED